MTEGPVSPAVSPYQGGRPDVTELDIEVVMERKIRIIGGAAKTASFQAATFGGWLVGWNIRESSGTAATVVKVHNGQSTDGQLTLSVGLASAGTDHDWWGDRGLDMENGFYVEIASGQADVILYVRPNSLTTP